MNRIAQNLIDISTLLRLEAQDLEAGRPLNPDRLGAIRALFDRALSDRPAPPATPEHRQDQPAVLPVLAALVLGEAGAMDLAEPGGMMALQLHPEADAAAYPRASGGEHVPARTLPFGMIGRSGGRRGPSLSGASSTTPREASPPLVHAPTLSPLPVVRAPLASPAGRLLEGVWRLKAPGTRLDIRQPEWRLRRVTPGYTVPEDALGFQADPEVLPENIDVHAHEQRRNVTITVRQAGWALLGADREAGLPERIATTRTRSYTVIHDGQPLTPAVPYITEEGLSGVLHLERLPAEPAPDAERLAELALRITELKALRRVLRAAEVQGAPEGPTCYTPAQQAWLQARGLTAAGYRPASRVKDSEHRQDVSVLEIKLAGLSSPPSVQDAYERWQRQARQTSAGQLMVPGFELLARLTGQPDGSADLFSGPRTLLVQASIQDALSDIGADLEPLVQEAASLRFAHLSAERPPLVELEVRGVRARLLTRLEPVPVAAPEALRA